MLPSYISYFFERMASNISINSGGSSNNSTTSRSISVKKLSVDALIDLLVTGGFVAIFGLTGLAISAIGTTIAKIFPWIAVLSGVVIIGIGIAKIFGKSVHISIPLPLRLIYSNSSTDNTTNSGGDANIPHSKHNNYNQSRLTYTRFFLFGIGYAVASLSCTLPIFLLVVFQGLSSGGIEKEWLYSYPMH